MRVDVGDDMFDLRVGHVIDALRELPESSVHCCVTSPPYYALREYDAPAQVWGGDPEHEHDWSVELQSPEQGSHLCSCGAWRGQLGLEPTPDLFIEHIVLVFREVRRVLRPDGSLWINMGDSYASTSTYNGPRSMATEGGWKDAGKRPNAGVPPGCKPKDLIGIPWKLAEALKAPYYTGHIKAERDRVWLAATLDAEGCISGYRHERTDDSSIRTGVFVTITNTCEALLDEAQRIWPAGRVSHDPREGSLGNRPAWRWSATDVDRNALLMRELWPYLIVKKKQALLAYNLFEMSKVAKRTARTGEAQVMKERRDWIVSAISTLNKGGDVDVPSWVAEPPVVTEQGWWLRSENIWRKMGGMPESVFDRTSRNHEHIFHLTPSARYFYDTDAVREPYAPDNRKKTTVKAGANSIQHRDGERWPHPDGKIKRTVWDMPTANYPGVHFAVFPDVLPEVCILATTSERGCCPRCGAPWERIVEADGESVEERRARQPSRSRDLVIAPRSDGGALQQGVRVGGDGERRTVGWEPTCVCRDLSVATLGEEHPPFVPEPCTALDPFVGTGTTMVVARRHGRRSVGVELSETYAETETVKRLGSWWKDLSRPQAVSEDQETLFS